MKMLVALALTFVLACEALADSTLDTRLFDAATSGDAEAVVALLNAGGDPNAKHTDGDTPLHIAAREGHTEAIAALLDADADPNAENHYRHTPLLYAAEKGHTEAITALLNADADPNTVGFYIGHYHTPLHVAARCGVGMARGGGARAWELLKRNPEYAAAWLHLADYLAQL